MHFLNALTIERKFKGVLIYGLTNFEIDDTLSWILQKM